MTTTHKIEHSFIHENCNQRLSDFIDLFNPDENEILTNYSRVITSLEKLKKHSKKGLIIAFNGFEINETLSNILKKTGKTIFVLHKINDNIKILYKGLDTEKECTMELHFFNNRLFLASFSYPNLFNGKRNQFLAKLLEEDKKIASDSGDRYLADKQENIIYIEDDAVLKVQYFNKTILRSLHQ